MKKINLIVLLFFAAVILLLSFNWKYSGETIVLYGFAHNQELKINLENDSHVKALYVEAGQRIKQGEILLEVTRSSIAVSQSDINNDILNLQSQYQLWKSGLKNSIRTVNAQKTEKKNELKSIINKLESEMSINASLIKEIGSINQVEDKDGNNPREVELKGLKEDLYLSMKTFDSEVRKLQNELDNSANPILIQIKKLKDNLDFVNEEEQSLSIVAKQDGIVGSILCKIGENIPAFTPFLTVYEETPNHVKGYVLETLILKVQDNDTLNIQSVSHPKESIKGIVIGMGSRIVEIPPRLRKNPDFATYGREIEIKIPSHNQFLQNEKVILKKHSLDQRPMSTRNLSSRKQ